MKKINEWMPKALDRSEVLRTARAQLAMQHWQAAVGEILAAKSRPDRFDRGTLWVLVEGSAWAQEISLRRELIIERLNTLAGENGLIRELRIGTRRMRIATGITPAD